MLIPATVALITFANTLPGDFVYDDELLIEKAVELREFSLERIFLENYWGADRLDRNYRPLTLLSYAVNFRLSTHPWGFHAVNVLLNACVAVLAFLVLLELLRDAPLAAAGASLYAVLPIHTEAVANVVGRAELLGAISIFGSWLCVLKSQHGRDSLWALGASLLALLGHFAKENVMVLLVLLPASSLILGRRMPWLATLGTAIASGAYLVARAVVLGARDSFIAFVDNPLVNESLLLRALNGMAHLWTYAFKTLVPVHLSADYSFNQLPVLTFSDAKLWVCAVGVLGIAGAATWAWRRGNRVGVLAITFFPVTFAPTCNVLLPIGTIFAERLAFTPSFAYPLSVCALLSSHKRASLRGSGLLVLYVLTVGYGLRAASRNADWSDRVTMYLRMPLDAPASAQSHLKASEAHIALSRKAKAPGEKARELKLAEDAVQRSIAIYSASGKGEAKQAEVLHLQGRHTEAVHHYTRAIAALTTHHQLDVTIFRLRGECLLALKRHAEAQADFDHYLKGLEGLGDSPDPAGLNFRGLALALQGQFTAALPDFDRAVALRKDWPELWNNRAMCRWSLKDVRGAIEDWQRALDLCRTQGQLHEPGKDSVHSFLLKLAVAQEAIAVEQRAAGNTEAARKAEAAGRGHRVEAANLVPVR